MAEDKTTETEVSTLEEGAEPVEIENLIPEKLDVLDINKILPQPPFRLMVVGQTGCGKTNVVLNLLCKLLRTRKGDLLFDHYFIYTPTALQDPSWTILPRFGFDAKNTTLRQELDLDEITDLTSSDDGTRNLIIIDDFAAHNEKLAQTAITDLFFRSRHANLSVIVTTQNMRSIPKKCRINCSHVIIFNFANPYELKIMETELASNKIFGDALTSLIKSLPKYHFLYKDVNRNILYMDFDRML
jgi:hypothetical protein